MSFAPAKTSWPAGQRHVRTSSCDRTTFLQVGDYYLVSHAHAHDLTVVTHEVPANSTKKIKIPNACIGLGVKCVNPYEMLRVEGARFVLGPA
jgi:hypothetical protein